MRRIVPCITIILLLSLSAPVKADAPESYGNTYGLLVATENQSKDITHAEALPILMKYAGRNIAKIDFQSRDSVCDSEMISCVEPYVPKRPLTQRLALIWLSELTSKKISQTPAELDARYKATWTVARQNNWIEGTLMNLKTLQEWLYRMEVSRKWKVPYFTGAVLNESEINISEWNNPSQVTTALFNLRKIMASTDLKNKSDFEPIYRKWLSLSEEIQKSRHPLALIPDLPEDIQKIIIQEGINSVAAQISYSYKHNISNRKHNLITGLMKMNGKVWKPGEEINVVNVLGEGGWGMFRSGWVIVGKTEEWAFGGGLCGVATMLYTPSWQAGLEIVRRFPHSRLFKSLYPKESVGLDATIYLGSRKNLIMKNNWDSSIMYYIHNNTKDQILTVYLLGNSPYRSAVTEGPIPLSRTAFKWIRTLTKFNGEVIRDEQITRYGGVYN